MILRHDSRVTRSSNIFDNEKEGISSVIHHKYKEYRIYIDLLIAELHERFEPWPEWLVLSERALNFANDLGYRERQESFDKLLNAPQGLLSPLLDDEKNRLNAEYVTLHLNAMVALKGLKEDSESKFKAERVWYILLSEEKFYRNC